VIKKRILKEDRLRRIDGRFSYIPHRFLNDGFLASLDQKELLLYLFLVLVSDRHGLSFYSYDSICRLLGLYLDQYLEARDGLISKDLIAFDGTIFQVLELPSKPIASGAKPVCESSLESGDLRDDRTRLALLIKQCVKGVDHD
jgi:hypothetical protein